MTMSFAESYVLASKVRSKLTREASNPKASLRSLVLQANMLDNLMDHISIETEKRKSKSSHSGVSKVSFAIPDKSPSMPVVPSVAEYEIDSDSDSDDDEIAVLSSSETDSDSDDEFYISSDDEDSPFTFPNEFTPRETEEEEEEDLSTPLVRKSNLMSSALSIIPEEGDDLPELTKSTSLSESDSFSDEDDDRFRVLYPENGFKVTSEALLRENSPAPLNDSVRHQRNSAIFLPIDMVY